MNAWDKKRRLMRRYDQSSRVYDGQYREEQGEKLKAALHSIRVTSESITLDVGCGTGLLLENIFQRPQLIVGTDISRGLLSRAKEKTKPFKSVALVQSDCENLPFRNGIFDVVLAVTVLQNVPRAEVALEEIKRVSGPNAEIVVTGLKKFFTQKKFIDVLAAAQLKITPIRADDTLKDYLYLCAKTR